MRMSSEHQKRVTDCIKAMSSGLADTIQHNPQDTIAPPLAGHDTINEVSGGALQHLSARNTMDKLEFQATLGQGGMGIIRLASQVALGRTVVVKSLRPDRRNEATTLDLLREAWITGSLEHPNVVPVHDIGVDEDGSPIIVLKHIEGVAWSQLMRDARTVRARFGAADLLEWNLDIFLQVVNAVRFAHSRGILHRDLKPDNVMIGEFGEVYVLDWGIAVSLHDDGSGRLPLASEARAMAGTPCYMAPEMLGDGAAPLSERTDIYLLGSILYEIITGRPPHAGSSVAEIITSVVTSEPPMPPGVPADLARICRRAMAPEPEERYDRAERLRQEVQWFLQHRGAARLADEAQHWLRELLALLAEPRADADWRQQLYKLFGACRFGFQESLSAWSDNEDARDGLRRAIIAMAEHELESGDPRAAEALLAELSDVPVELRIRVNEVLRAQRSEKERIAELEKLGAQLDMTAGARTRTLVAGLLALMWTLFPLVGGIVGYWKPEQLSRQEILSWTLLFLAILLAMVVWARESLMKTAVNRRITAALIFTFGAQLALQLGTGLAGLPAATTVLIAIFLWACVAGLLAITIDQRIVIVSAGYFMAFWLSAWRPESTLFAISGANFITLIGALLVGGNLRTSYERQAQADP